jgi:hypothetical protein
MRPAELPQVLDLDVDQPWPQRPLLVRALFLVLHGVSWGVLVN